jgi:hypothetical protein
MRMDGEVDQRRLLVFVEKIEGIFVDLIKVSRAAPEGAVALRRFYPIPIRYRQDAKRAKKSSVYLGALCAFARDCCYLIPISYRTKAQPVAKKLCYRLLKKMSERRMSQMECWNIAALGFERSDPSFHPSTIPTLRP